MGALWTDKEIRIVKDNYETATKEKLQELLPTRSWKTITKRGTMLKFSRINFCGTRGKNPEHSKRMKAKWAEPTFRKKHLALQKERKFGYRKAEEHPMWNGGIRRTKNGYIRGYAPDHPNNSGGYVLQHRLAIERHIGRYLLPYEQVHHINGVKDDNRIENLEIRTKSGHRGHLVCPYCNKGFEVSYYEGVKSAIN